MYADLDRNGDHRIVPSEDIIGAHLYPVSPYEYEELVPAV